MLGFSQLSKPIKWQDFLEKEENGRNAFRTGAKIQFSEKKYFGVRCTLEENEFQKYLFWLSNFLGAAILGKVSEYHTGVLKDKSDK